MAPLKTKTIRVTEEQELDLSINYKDKSSFLFRELFDVFRLSETPGIAIIRLRQKIKEIS
jgi:hypothetical protein